MALKGDFIESQLLGYIEVIMQTLACLVISIIMLIYIKYFCINKKNDDKNSKNKVDKRFHLLLLGSLVASLIYIYSHYILHTILVLILGYKPNNFCLVSSIILFPMFMQRLHIYIFFTMRLYMTFKGSVVQINKIKIKIIIATMIVIGIFIWVFNTVISYNIKEFFCYDDDLAYLMYVSLMLMVSNDNFWLILLSYLYIKKLRELMKIINSSGKRNDDKLINVANKLTILAVFTVVSSIIIIILHVILSLIFSSVMVSVDLIINNISVMLSFGIFNESYKKYCCACIKIKNKCCDVNHDGTELIKGIELNSSTKTSQE